jgi:hypothetical protein
MKRDESIRRNTMEIESLLTESTNLVEVYVCPTKVDYATKQWVNVGWNAPYKLGTGFGVGNKQELKEYHHRDLTYMYDLANDGQRAYRKLAQNEAAHRSMYAVSYLEETVPTHRFPCTQEVAHEDTIVRTTYRINNRIHFIHDTDKNQNNYYYFRYQHSDNVDLKKIQSDFNKSCGYLRKIGMVQ